MVVFAFLIIFLVMVWYEIIRRIVTAFRSPPTIVSGDDEKDDTRHYTPLDNELESIAIQRDTLTASIQHLDRAYMEETNEVKRARLLQQIAMTHGKLEKLDKRENKIIEIWDDG